MTTIPMFRMLPDLPKLPQVFVDQALALTILPQENQGTYVQRVLQDWKGISAVPNRICRGKFGDDFEHWVGDVLGQGFKQPGLAWFRGSPQAPSTGAHTDVSRDFVIIWNIDEGGPGAELAFWQEQGQPVVRPRNTHLGSTRTLTQIGSHRHLVGSWYLIHTRVLHSMENIVRTRLNFQIGFDTELPALIKEML